MKQAVGLALLFLVSGGLCAEVEVPAGFAHSILVDDLPGTSQIAWTPDGDLVIGGQQGLVWLWDGDLVHTILTLPVSVGNERGLNGLVLDPDFATNSHVWIYYTSAGPEIRNRVSRFTFQGGLLIGETTLLEGPLVSTGNHNSGGMAFASDKTLFVAMGDDEQGSPVSRNPFDLRGKILHIRRNGGPAPGNPYFDGALGDPRVWSMGFRNPYRISVEPGSDIVFVGDVGRSTWEEINLAIPGADYGWGDVEGYSPADAPGVTYPLHLYHHMGSGAAIVGGDHARPGDFAPQYEGDYFFSDNIRGILWRMRLDDSRNVVFIEEFATGLCRPTNFRFGPDGALYYASFKIGNPSCTEGAVERIGYVGDGNDQPIAAATIAPSSGPAPLAVNLDGTASSDPDGDPLSYLWDLGDGTTDTDAVVGHSFPLGEYHAKLTVDDGDGGQDSTHLYRIVSGNTAPAAEITTPADESTYVAGQAVSFSGAGFDSEEGALPCANLEWRINFRAPGRIRPALGPLRGTCNGQWTVPVDGDADPMQWYEIQLAAADTGVPIGTDGVLRGAATIEIRPETAVMSFRTVPLADLRLTLDGSPLNPPADVTGVIGAVRTLAAAASIPRENGHTYRWLSWSDGGSRIHQISTPPTDTVFTATYGCDVIAEVNELRVDTDSSGKTRLSWASSPDLCLASDESAYQVYTAATGAPTAPPGSFPDDPAWALVGTTSETTFTFTATDDDRFFLVVATGTDDAEGPVGHYGR